MSQTMVTKLSEIVCFAWHRLMNQSNKNPEEKRIGGIMRKRTLAMITVAVVVAAFAGKAGADIVDPCKSEAQLNAGATPVALYACPQGDTPSFASQGWSIDIVVRDRGDNPVPAIPAADFWLVDCNPVNDIALCGGAASTNADGPTDAAGMTSMSSATFAGGGCANRIAVVVQGLIIGCEAPACLDVSVRTPDLNGDLTVGLVDLSLMAAAYPPQPYGECADFDLNGIVNLQDLAHFSLHFGPPGHVCE